MHWRKNRIVNPEAKEHIVEVGRCPGCGREVKFYHCEPISQFCSDCRNEAEAAWKEERIERVDERKVQKKRNR